MQKPEIPLTETTRLKSLNELNILDTPAEERFDCLTRLAKRTFNVPTVLVSLVDEERQWFKSSIGVDVCETSREVSFCGHAINEDNVFVIPNAKVDQRFADNPLVTANKGIRFYAGYPLKALNGEKLGTLCIIDYEARSLDDTDIETLKDLGSMVERELSVIHLATKDHLTNIANRRGFMLAAQQSLKFSLRHELPATLVYFDINKFKPINDKYGHLEGDKALTTFANNLKSTFRASDVIARMGGDEFVALMCDANKAQAEEAISSLKQITELYNLESDNPYDISFSYGAVEYNKLRHANLETLVAEADARMFENKKQKKTVVKKLVNNVVRMKNFSHAVTN